MRILFDNQIFSRQSYGGVVRYFCELLSSLRKHNNLIVKIPKIYLRNETNFYTQNKKKNTFLVFYANKILKKIKREIKFILDKTSNVSQLKKQEFDIFHPTYYDPYFLSYLKDKPFVLTIYDMIQEKFPEYFGQENQTCIQKALLAKKASKIIAISQNTKKDIVNILGIKPEKIEVIYLATTPEENMEQIPIPNFYILFVGGRGRYKNFSTVAKAFSNLSKNYSNLFLVCTGHDFSEDENNILAKLGISSKSLVITANPQQLAFLYSNAKIFIFPSKYEGFGLPILEAFSYKCPIILSNASCFPEIAGKAALYFETEDPLSLEKTIETLLNDGEMQKQLIQRGLERLKLFSWETTADKTLSLYQQCLLAN